MTNSSGEALGFKSIIARRGLWELTPSLQEALDLVYQQPDLKEKNGYMKSLVNKRDF